MFIWGDTIILDTFKEGKVIKAIIVDGYGSQIPVKLGRKPNISVDNGFTTIQSTTLYDRIKEDFDKRNGKE